MNQSTHLLVEVIYLFMDVPSPLLNDQWRIVFRFEQGDAYDVEITDYY